MKASRHRKWEDCVDAVVREAEESAWDRDYVSAEMALIRYNMLLERDGEAQAAAYALANVHIGKMRTLAIRHAIERGQFDEAIQLALDNRKELVDGDVWRMRGGNCVLRRTGVRAGWMISDGLVSNWCLAGTSNTTR
ncbi:hypothetical protein AAC03nite_31980 [Alicyclobacillus acidoterrestris]|nr:hypothetical protein AAC03nite_31980 [Alicyclobacillus acidoterrestris]